MTSKKPNHTMQGSWRGRYFYTGNVHQPCGFEAVFLESNGIIDGNILDDGNLGEASVGGTFTYPSIAFTKAYRQAGLSPVSYKGTMSEDGNRLSGTWAIRSGFSGTWTTKGNWSGTWVAVRLDGEEMLEFDETLGDERPKEEEHEKVLVCDNLVSLNCVYHSVRNAS